MKIISSNTIGEINQHSYGRLKVEDFLFKAKQNLLFVSHITSSFTAAGKQLMVKQSAFLKTFCNIMLRKQYVNENYSGNFIPLRIMDNNSLQKSSFQFSEPKAHYGIHYSLKNNFHYKKNIYSNTY